MSKKLNDIKFSRNAKTYQEHSYVCSRCGHKNAMGYKVDKRICSWCGAVVHKDDRRFFKDKIRQYLNGVIE